MDIKELLGKCVDMAREGELDNTNAKEAFFDYTKEQIIQALSSPQEIACGLTYDELSDEAKAALKTPGKVEALSSPVGVNKLDEFTEGEIQKIFKKVRDPEFTNLIAYEADVLVEEIKRLRKLVK